MSSRKAVESAHYIELLRRDHEVILSGPTGVAASNIDGSTYDTALGLGISDQKGRIVSERVRSLWKSKTIMIVDEVSMIGLKTLNAIDDQCSRIKSVSSTSTSSFGSIPVVIFLGDFYRFPPLKSTPLSDVLLRGLNAEG